MYVGSTPCMWFPHHVWVLHHVSEIMYQVLLVSELDLELALELELELEVGQPSIGPITSGPHAQLLHVPQPP